MAATASSSSSSSSWVGTLVGVARESKRVVATHTRHFLALSVLFLLPLSLLLVAAPTSPSSLLHSPPKTLLRSGLTRPPAATIAAAAAAAALLSLCAAAAVTRSVLDGFFGRPVRLAAALRSLPAALWRLLLTSLSAALALATFAATVASVALLCLRVLSPLLGPRHQHLPLAVFATAGAALALGAVYLQVNWAIAGVVTVAESNWGFEPLRRSAHLVRGMRCGVLCLIIFFSAGIGLLVWCADLGTAVEVKDWRGAAPVVARVVCASAVIMWLLLYSLVSTTVLYIYCKALHGELAGEIAEEFAREYVCLPFHDRKVPHVVSVVWQ